MKIYQPRTSCITILRQTNLCSGRFTEVLHAEVTPYWHFRASTPRINTLAHPPATAQPVSDPRLSVAQSANQQQPPTNVREMPAQSIPHQANSQQSTTRLIAYLETTQAAYRPTAPYAGTLTTRHTAHPPPHPIISSTSGISAYV